MRAKYTIGHKVYEPGAVDDMGNEVDAWADSVDLKVYSIAPSASLADVEPEPGRQAVMTLMSVLVPAGALLGPHDRYVIDGDEWEQEGEDGDYTRGPFRGPRSAGIVLNLKRVEG
jgi:hypothetical protein